MLSSSLPLMVLAIVRTMRGRWWPRPAHDDTDAPLQAATVRALADTLSDPRCTAELRAAADRHEQCLMR